MNISYGSRKGQLTVFIIIGIVLLFSTALVLYLTHQKVNNLPKVEVPSEVEPVHNYVTSCLESVGRQGLVLLGLQGGFINVPDKILYEKSYVKIGKTGFIKVPYWYYRGESRIPSIEFMERELSSYTEKNLRQCLGDYGQLKQKFNISELSDIHVVTYINKDNVVQELDYKLGIRKLSNSKYSEISRYITQHNVNLRQIYEFANITMHAENQHMFLENTTIDFMAMHPDIPFTDMRFYCGTLKWRINDIKKTLANILYYNLPRARFDKTDYPPFSAPESVYKKLSGYTIEDINKGHLPDFKVPDDAYDYFHLFYHVTDKDFSNLKASISYSPDYGMKLYARPSAGGVMRSNMMPGAPKYLSYICINLYHFTYDVEYPVLINLFDPSAFHNQGYTFRFATPVIIDHNRGLRRDNPTSIFDNVFEQEPDYCNQLSDEEIYIQAKGVRHGYINQDLPGVNITYDCLKFKCNLGVTHNVDGAYRLRARLPEVCSYGFIIASKPGYLTTTRQYDGSTHFEISLPKLQNYTVRVIKHKNGNPQSRLELINNEAALINLYDKEHNYVVYTTYKSDNPMTLPLILDNVNYSLDILLVDYKSGHILGGYRSAWNTNVENMLDKTNITFNVVYPLVRPPDYELINNLYYNESYKQTLAPEFS